MLATCQPSVETIVETTHEIAGVFAVQFVGKFVGHVTWVMIVLCSVCLPQIRPGAEQTENGDSRWPEVYARVDWLASRVCGDKFFRMDFGRISISHAE